VLVFEEIGKIAALIRAKLVNELVVAAGGDMAHIIHNDAVFLDLIDDKAGFSCFEILEG